MDIDTFLSDYDFDEKHELFMPDVSPEEAYRALKGINFSDSRLLRILIRLRGIRPKTQEHQMFTVLSDREPDEIVLGLIAKPWTLSVGTVSIPASEFTNFSTPGFAKIAWNFTFSPLNNGTLASTITRIKCMDITSRTKFRLYWFVIKPFSGLMRIKMLRMIKAKSIKMRH